MGNTTSGAHLSKRGGAKQNFHATSSSGAFKAADSTLPALGRGKNASMTSLHHPSSMPNLAQSVKGVQLSKMLQSSGANQFSQPSSPPSTNTFSPQVYFKIASEFQRMNQGKAKQNEEIISFLAAEKQNQERMKKLEEKYTLIEKEHK